MGRDREAALVVDLGDRRAQRPERLDRPLDEQRQQVAAEGRDLLADDDLEPQALVAGHRPRGDGGVDALVVGDRDDVEARCGRSTWSRISTDVARSRRTRGCGCAGRRGRAVGPSARRLRDGAGALASRLEVRPDREEDRPPLLRARGDDVARRPAAWPAIGRRRARAGCPRRDGDGLEAAAVAARAVRRTPTT